MAADLEFRIGAELTEIKGALAALRKDFATVGQAAQQAGGNQAFSGLERSARGAIGTVGRLVAGFVTLAGAVRLIGAADELNTLNARIRLVTASTEEYNRAQVALFELAQRTRSSLGETINLYSRIAQATKEAGVGQEVLLQVVETVNQAVQLSGASTQAAEAALIQLGQGIASGTLRGEELNSVLEQTPALADAIAKGMGITRGELREYGQAGKISAEQVIAALQAQRDEVARQFAELPLTVGQSVTLLKNASLQLLGAFNESTGATAGLADVIRDLSEYLSSDEAIGAIVEFAATWSNAFALIVNDVTEAVAIIESATASIAGSADGMVGFLIRAFKQFPVNIRASLQIVTVLTAAAVDKVIAYGELMRDSILAIFSDDTLAGAAARYERRLAAIEEAARDSIDGALAQRDEALRAAEAARQDAQRRRQAGRVVSNRTSTGTFRAKTSDAEKAKAQQELKAQLDAEEKLQRDAVERAKQFYADLYEDAKLSAADYFATRQALELQAIDQAIAVERRRAEAGGVDRIKALAEIELLERQKNDIRQRAQREQAAAALALDRELEQARAQDLDNRGQTGEAARIRLEAQYRDLLRRMEAEGNATGARLIRGLIDTGVAQAQFAELKAQFDRVLADLQARQQSLEAQRNTGAISPDIASQQQVEARAQASAQLADLNAKLQELAQRTNDPRIVEGARAASQALQQLAIDGAQGIDAAMIDLRASLANLERDFARTATSAGVDALTNLFTDLASGTKSAGDALRDFVVGFVQSMAQIAARALATYIVLQTLDAIYPGLGRATVAFMGVGAAPYHSGGMVSPGAGVKRQMPAWMFAGAPRFHSGGMVGLKPGEVPAVLQTGEEVLSRADPRNAANGGASGGGTRIINVIDPALVQDYMTSSAGERTILNVIERNAGAVRQKLA